MMQSAVAVNDAYTTNEDTPLTAVSGKQRVLLNDTDVEGVRSLQRFDAK